MQIGTIVLLLVLALTGLFAALNWTVFTTPVPLWLGVTSIDAPLGVILLGVIVVLSLVFVAAAVATQARVIAESRRQARELKAQRDLADQAEASRFTELRNFTSAELLRVTQASDAARDGILARIERMETQLRMLVEQTGNTLSSYIGQLDDRVEAGRRAWPERPAPHEAQPPQR